MAAFSTAILAGAALAGAYVQSQSAQQESDYQQRMYELNAKVSESNAEDATIRGDKAADQHRSKVKQLIGAQRAAAGASGADLNTGSMAELQADTAAMGAIDELTIRNNAWREANGYRVAAASSRGQGDLAGLAGANKSRNTLLTGGLQAAREVGIGLGKSSKGTKGGGGGGYGSAGGNYKDFSDLA